jgi:hypothetical protein
LFVAAGSLIISALILAAVLWKAGEERWKAYIPVYRDAVMLRIVDLPGALALLGPAAFGLYLGSVLTKSSGGLLTLSLLLLAYAVGLAYYVFVAMAVWRIGRHLRHDSIWWLALAIFAPGVSLIVFAVDQSIWHENEELGLQTGRIAKEVPTRLY